MASYSLGLFLRYPRAREQSRLKSKVHIVPLGPREASYSLEQARGPDGLYDCLTPNFNVSLKYFIFPERVEGQRSSLGNGQVFRHRLSGLGIHSRLGRSRPAQRRAHLPGQRRSQTERFDQQNVDENSGSDQVYIFSVVSISPLHTRD